MNVATDTAPREAATSWPTRSILGVPINAMTMDDVLSLIDETIQTDGRLHIGVVNAAKVVNMRRTKSLADAVLSSDIILADGQSVVWAAKLLGKKLPERIAGIDLMHAMISRGEEKGHRFYFLGAKEEVLDEAVRRLQTQHPRMIVAGKYHGYFGSDEEASIVANIAAAEADILFVAMTSPKKEIFLANWSNDLNISVCHGVGGAFDVVAGLVQRAPMAWQRVGMEWLYRVIQEPRRMWRRYLVTNTLFCGMVLGEFVRGLFAPSSRSDSSRS